MNVRSLLSRGKGTNEARQRRFLHFNLSNTGVGALLCSIVLLLLSSCSLFPAPAKSGTPTTDAGSGDSPTSIVSPTTTPTGPAINFSISGCPTSLPAIKWDSLAGTKPGVNKVQHVSCGTFENGALAALVLIRYYSPDSKMDFAVYDNLFGTPARRFSVQGLIGGDARISPTNTIMTAENPNNDSLGPNVFKEYQWNGSAYTQILFPGMFPDATHYQAEQSQALVNTQLAQATATPNANPNIWQTSAFGVLNRLASNIFHWTSVSSKTLIFNPPSGTYTFQTFNNGPGGGGFSSTLMRLDNVATNIFEIKQITSIDGTLLLSSPAYGITQPLTSPVKVSGSYNSTGTILGRAALYDDTYVLLGDTGATHGSASTGLVAFAPTVSYKLDTQGLQEGIVAFYVTNQNNIALSNQVILLKVFFSA
jgi:hypothetical protein